MAVWQLQEAGLSLVPLQIQDIGSQYVAGAQTADVLLETRSPADKQAAASDSLSRMIGPIMGRMTLFYSLFIGAGKAETILIAEEKSTLLPLFTTPTPLSVILGGEFLDVALVVILQISAMLRLARLIVDIRWQKPPAVGLIAASTVPAASPFGIFLMSWPQTTHQASVAFDGLAAWHFKFE